jgi:hypothetical protein
VAANGYSVRRHKLTPNGLILSLNHWRSDMKKFFATLAVLTVIAMPAFVQSFSASPFGTGNVLPFAYKPAAPQTEKIAVGQSGLNSFAKVPKSGSAFNSNSPAATGGGSLGYNENLLNY